jgi:ribose transport system permease protein
MSLGTSAEGSHTHSILQSRTVPERFQLWAAEHSLVVLAILLVLMIVAAGVAIPGFFALRQVPVLLSTVAILGVFGAGQQMPILTGGIDLSNTAVATAAGFVSAILVSHQAEAIIAALGFGVLVGVINGLFIGYFQISALIVTLGMQGILTGGIDVYTASANEKTVPPAFLIHLGSLRYWGYLPAIAIVWAAVCVGVFFVLERTKFGKLVYAVGSNPEACRLAGVNTNLILLVVYAIAGLLAAAAGLLLAGFSSAVFATSASNYLLPTIAVVVIGGTSILGGSGSFVGTILGTLIVSVLDVLLTLINAVGTGEDIVFGAVIIGLAWIYGWTEFSA